MVRIRVSPPLSEERKNPEVQLNTGFRVFRFRRTFRDNFFVVSSNLTRLPIIETK